MFDKVERIVVTGGRHYEDRATVFKILDEYQPSMIIHGACRINCRLSGADRFANEYGIERGINVVSYPADWDLYGRSAGPRRNKIMLKESFPDLVIRFPGGAGSAGCLKMAKEMKIPTREILS